MSDVGSARRAKEQLKNDIGAEPFCAGVGVEREDGIGFVVRVSVRPGTLAEAKARVPARIGDVVVKIVEAD
ncbi:hypothetical protein [Polyangium sp. y55x31]|uniref:hypothetical protein n=1 Tax=Polyangium sp. y55x31 TaxID=3042688 RepID=UPI0024830481|nr:hypothetical protein [Polyangium sp. y55x31]MDI1478815.1 hypothetical protein [Polyangium sp. y55x31]